MLTSTRYEPKTFGLNPDPASHEPGSMEAIYCEAFQKSDAAATYTYVEYGGDPAYCGFAWVKIKPARGPFIAFCKKHGIGDNDVYGGWSISAPCSYSGQSIDIKEAAAHAFAQVLVSHGIRAWMSSRAD